MRTLPVVACVALALGLAAGCAEESRYDAVLLRTREMEKMLGDQTAKTPTAATAGRAETTVQTAAAEAVASVEPRKVVYTGSFTVLVPDAAAAVEATRRLAESMGGYMQHSTLDSIVVRIPAARFGEAAEALKNIGTVTDRQIDAQDVTEEYEDLELRLKSARALLDKLLALLEKAQNVKDAMEVEREAARVRAEIEKLEGQKNRLSSRIAYATLTVRFTPTKEAPRELKAALPFFWLRELGIEHLMNAFGL
ncbi:MAG: DUF4349 domain-containing protein [Planctomycetota bacterium]|nr:DUF4349 domain-containing protein [Planctomycetota bacterium]